MLRGVYLHLCLVGFISICVKFCLTSANLEWSILHESFSVASVVLHVCMWSEQWVLYTSSLHYKFESVCVCVCVCDKVCVHNSLVTIKNNSLK